MKPPRGAESGGAGVHAERTRGVPARAAIEVDAGGAMDARVKAGRGSWPYAAARTRAMPCKMPGGVDWPQATVAIEGRPGTEATGRAALSVVNQRYPGARALVTDDPGAIKADPADGILVFLRPGEALAPDALLAAAIAMRATGAGVVCGVCTEGAEPGGGVQYLCPLEGGVLDERSLGRAAGFGAWCAATAVTARVWERAGRPDLRRGGREAWLGLSGSRLAVVGHPFVTRQECEGRDGARRGAPADRCVAIIGRMGAARAALEAPAERLAGAMAALGVRAVPVVIPDPRESGEYEPASADAAARTVGLSRADAVVLADVGDAVEGGDAELRRALGDTPVAPAEALGDALWTAERVFRARPRETCREVLGLASDRFVIACVCERLSACAEGLRALAEGLDAAGIPDSMVAASGEIDSEPSRLVPGMAALGSMPDAGARALLLGAADLVVLLGSSDDVRLAAEAAACGTAVVALASSPAGGVVAQGLTGVACANDTAGCIAKAIRAMHADGAEREGMGAAAAVWAGCIWSRAAACHGLAHALARLDWPAPFTPDGLELRARGAAPESAVEVAPPRPWWRAVQGFDAWEGPQPEVDLPRCRWSVGPAGLLELHASEPGEHSVFVEVRNFWPHQRLRAVLNGKVVCDQPVPVTRHDRSHIVHFKADLGEGPSDLHVLNGIWDATTPRRQLALLYLGIRVVSRSGVESVERLGRAGGTP